MLLDAAVTPALGTADLWLPLELAFLLAAVSVADDVRGFAKLPAQLALMRT